MVDRWVGEWGVEEDGEGREVRGRRAMRQWTVKNLKLKT
jgi:hypothetical protein